MIEIECIANGDFLFEIGGDGGIPTRDTYRFRNGDSIR